jgi:hypothetical protein
MTEDRKEYLFLKDEYDEFKNEYGKLKEVKGGIYNMRNEVKIQKSKRGCRVTIPAFIVKEFNISPKDKIIWNKYRGNLKATLKKIK